MRQGFLYSLLAFFVSCFLMSPGVWWPDSLNAYIQGVVGVYGSAQPPLLAILSRLLYKFFHGPLPLFLFCNALYFGGIGLFVFYHVKHKIIAPLLYFLIVFFPLTLANIAVIQTETIQLSILALLIPFILIMKDSAGKLKTALFFVSIILLGLFYHLRYEAVIISLILSYSLWYAYLGSHKLKVPVFAIATVILISFSGNIVFKKVINGKEISSEMSYSLLVADIAAISAESGKNYIPDYCWKDFLNENEKNVGKITYGYLNWKGSFYSYIFNVDPAVGLFAYPPLLENKSNLVIKWLKTVSSHPIYYMKYKLTYFTYLLTNEYFNMGLWSGINDSKESRAKIEIELNDDVKNFILNNKERFTYRNGNLVYTAPLGIITDSEIKELVKLVGERRKDDVVWMKWYSNISSSDYRNVNPYCEKTLQPFYEICKQWGKFFCCLLPYFIIMLMLPILFFKVMKRSANNFFFFMLCGCGVLHLMMRMIFLTDSVFRFGLISLIFLYYAVVLLIGELIIRKFKVSFSFEN